MSDPAAKILDTGETLKIETLKGPAITEARLDIHPDGGMARLRLFGRLTPDGLQRVKDTWDASG